MALDRSIVQEVLEEASHLAGEARERFLGARCEGDAELREEVESLLSALERSPDATMTQAVRFVEKPVDGVGDQIGPYKLRQQIGEGGFGVVYMAEQTRPVRRTVALKIIKPGMDTRQVVARFEAERQALALMDHPNIAKVLDGGATPTGRPYFVMELVRGVPITEYCDVNQLELRERLELFVAVCQAVQHAHQKGIIHRDIKPGNVLVTMADGRPTPKVIDFGIAKATDQRLTERTLFTEFRQMIGTPAYMSPEQAEMAGIDIDTRSDVYSLGVLLYELLVGATPFGAEELRDKAYGEMQRIIREVEPPRPSTKLSTMPGTLASVAAQRRIEPRRLAQTLRGELDWIVMRAMEKDRTRRYETANGLGADVRRYLDGEAVTAAPPTKSYLLRKFLRRHRGPVVAGAVVAGALVLGVIGTTLAMLDARHQRSLAEVRLIDANFAREAEEAQRRRAEENERAAKRAAELARQNETEAMRQARKSDQVASFLKEMLSGVSPSVARGRDTTMLREILDRTAQRVVTALKDQPEVEADLLRTLGRTYSDLDEKVASEQMFRKLLQVRRSIFHGDHPDVADALALEALGMRGISRYADSRRRWTEAESLARQAVEMWERLPGQPPSKTVNALRGLALILTTEGKYKEAEGVYRRILALLTDPNSKLHYYNGLAIALREQGNIDEAASLQDTAIRELRAAAAESGSVVAPYDLINYADTLVANHDLKGAEKVLKEVIEDGQSYLSPGQDAMVSARRRLIAIYVQEGRKRDAEDVQRQQSLSTRPSTRPVRWETASIDPSDFEDLRAEQSPTTRPHSLPPAVLDPKEPGEGPARNGDFAGAAAELTKRLKDHYYDSQAMLTFAAVLAESSNWEGYAAHCHRILSDPGQMYEYTPRRIAQASLLGPLPPADRLVARRFADAALKQASESPGSKKLPYVQLIKGLAEYREEHYDDAIEWTEKGMKGLRGLISDSGYCVIAMADWKLNRRDDARAALKRAEAAVAGAWFNGSRTELGSNWLDAIMAHVLLREAQETIGH